ncbi:MAG: hypothetical protein KTR25_06685 [Myxococcales bacterium]|nr:hypothetical protein [Myxococcales bacterium]
MNSQEFEDIPSPPVAEIEAAHHIAQQRFKTADRVVDNLGNVRLLLVVTGMLLVIMPLYSRNGTPWWGLVPLAVAFLILGKIQDRWQERRRVANAGLQYLEHSLARLREQWRGSADTGAGVGQSWIGGLHYADDLDIFGPSSLYQLISTAITMEGRRTLARWLCVPASPTEVVERQQAVRALAADLKLRQRCFAAAAVDDVQSLPSEALLEWAEGEERLPWMPGLSVIGWVLPLLFLSTFTWGFIVGGPRVPFYGMVVIHGIVLFWTRKWMATRIDVLAGPERVLHRYARLIEVVEQLPKARAARLDILRNQLVRGSKGPASKEVQRLEAWVEMLNARLNMFFALTLGPALLWELNVVLRTEAWRLRVGREFRLWLEVLGEVEALASMGAFAYERPEYVFPEWTEDGPVWSAEKLVHPLIDKRKVVANDLSLGEAGAVTLLSGSNMSGKSTLLRAVGLSVVLAGAGAPVPARRMRLRSVRLATSVRVVDSLAQGASHFYAELRRLKQVIDLARTSGPPVLYLLDELLHGTNSRERYLGAVSVVKWLSEVGAVGMVTTHDLGLARVASFLPKGKVVNTHFSDDVSGNGLQFDYHLRPGLIQTTNALRMMRAVGIDVQIVDSPDQFPTELAGASPLPF